MLTFLLMCLSVLDLGLSGQDDVALLASLRTEGQGVGSISFSPNWNMMAVASTDGDVELWDVLSSQRTSTLRRTFSVKTVRFNGDGASLTTAGDGAIRVWDMLTYQPAKIYEDSAACALDFSPDGRLLASGGYDTVITLRDTSSGKVRAKLKGHTEGKETLFGYTINCLSFSKNGKLLASGGADGTVRLWDIASGTLKKTLKVSAEPVSSVAFSPNGKLLATGDFDGGVTLWCAATGKLVAALKGHKVAVSAVAFSPDGKLLASVGGEGVGDEEWEEPPEPNFEIKLWDVATGCEKVTLSGDSGQIRCVAFSPDGTVLATGDCANLAGPGDGPGRVRLWDVRTLLNRTK